MTRMKAYENMGFLKSASARPVRILAEYLEPRSRFHWAKVQGTVVIMGASRLRDPDVARIDLQKAKADLQSHPEDDRLRRIHSIAKKRVELTTYYTDARELARRLTEWSQSQPPDRKVLICTGAGPGIMEAGNRGASDAGGESIGLGISMNINEPMNPYVSPKLQFMFHYFFMRKFWFLYVARAIILFPGGFGTMDELFEVLTLKQTGKINRPLPIVLYGSTFWKRVIDWDYLSESGLIADNDPELYRYCDTTDEVMAYLVPQLEERTYRQGGG